MLRTFQTFLLLISGFAGTLSAQSLRPAPFFVDHAVLQRNKPITIFGQGRSRSHRLRLARRANRRCLYRSVGKLEGDAARASGRGAL